MNKKKLIKPVATGKKFVCLKCGGEKTEIDYETGGHQVAYFTKPGCRHKWKLTATGHAFPNVETRKKMSLSHTGKGGKK